MSAVARVEDSLCVSPVARMDAHALPALAAAVPYRLSVDGPSMTFVATLVGSDGEARVVARAERSGGDAPLGCFVVDLPHGVVAGGRATLVIEATRGRVRVRRDMVIE